MLPPILEIERQVVNNQLGYLVDPNAATQTKELIDRINVLNERRTALAQPVPQLPRFEPAQMTYNVHVD